jgi:23S rRNA (uracil1939-C5)-methyltransferase
VPGALPGEEAVVATTREHARFCDARIVELTRSSPQRIKPACPHAGECGGCPWQVLDYAQQPADKRRLLLDALERIGGFDAQRAGELVRECVAPANPWGYRNKVEFQTGRDAAGRLFLGLHGAGSEAVTPVQQCLLLPKQAQKLPAKLAGALRYVLKGDVAGIGRVGIRCSQRTGDLEVALWGEPGPMPRSLVAKVVGDATGATSIVRVLTGGPAKARKIKGVEVLAGKGYWRERLGEYTLKLSAPSFFQVNSKGAAALVEPVMAALRSNGVEPGATVLDLYSGAGTFTLPLAEHYDVCAVEAASSSIADLRRNLAEAGLDAEIIGGDVARELPGLADARAAVIDPPRAGIAPEVRTALIGSPMSTLVYVSCNPATLARDLKELAAGGLEPLSITPVDLFPQTPHVETVTILARSR